MYWLYGCGEQVFSGAHEAWLNGAHPGDRAACEFESQRALRGVKEYDTGVRVVWPDGSVHHIRVKADVLCDADGGSLRVIGANFDVIEFQEKGRAVERTVARPKLVWTVPSP